VAFAVVVGMGSYAQCRSMPSIPGYLEPSRRGTLADLWARPAGDYPDELWLVDDLRSVTDSPWMASGGGAFLH
jgi:hypothetical protein